MDKNKLILPISILLGCIILGGFYYTSESNKQASIEKQQQLELQAKKEDQQAAKNQNNIIAIQKARCVEEAKTNAIYSYENSPLCKGDYGTPPDNCNDGTTYYVAQYDTAYSTCLESKGLK
jgi:hypothetical protein